MVKRFNPVDFYDKKKNMPTVLRGAPTTKLDRVKLDTSPTTALGGVARVAKTFAEQIRAANEKKVSEERRKMRSALLRAYMAPKKVFDPTAGEASIMDDDAPEEMPEVSQYDDAEAAFNEANPSGMEAALRVQSQYVPPESGMFGPGEGAFNNMGDNTINELSLLEYNNRLAKEERERALAGTIAKEKRQQANAMALARIGKSERPQDRVTFVDGDNNKFVRNMSNPGEAEEAKRMIEAGTWNQLQAGYKSRPSAAIQQTTATTELRDTLARLKREGKTGTYEYNRIAQKLTDLLTNIAEDPQSQAALAQARKTGAEVGKTNSKDYFAARDVVNNVKDIDSMISRLQATDDSTLGFLTNLNLLKNRVMAKAGNQDALKKVNDAEMINSLSGKEVFELIKALGIGARGLDTPAERKFLREVLTGTNELTKETLLEMAMERRKIQIRNVEKWNKGLKEGLYERFYSNTGYMKRPLEVPGPAPVFAPTDISGEISKMNAVQLNEKAKSATADEKEEINLRLGVLGF